MRHRLAVPQRKTSAITGMQRNRSPRANGPGVFNEQRA